MAVAATALNNVYSSVEHADPGDENPTLADAVPVSNVFDDENVAILSDIWPSGIDAVSAILMAREVINEYSVNPAVEAESAWVVTFPTKWAYVDGVVPAAQPFSEPFYDPSDPDSVYNNGKSCDEVSAVAYDREEFSKEEGLDFSPRPPGGKFQLCYEANVLQFGDSDVFSAELTESRLNNPPGKNGWLDLGFNASANVMVGSDNYYLGLPVIGFKATVLGNSNVGVGASYAAGVAHAYNRVHGVGSP